MRAAPDQCSYAGDYLYAGICPTHEPALNAKNAAVKQKSQPRDPIRLALS
jgi:hypothetical protein